MSVEIFNIDTFTPTSLRSLDFKYTGYNNLPILFAVDEFVSKGGEFGRILTQNHRNMVLDYNGIWQRDEALASVDQALLLELPTNNNQNMLPQGFWARLEADLTNIIELFESVMGSGS